MHTFLAGGDEGDILYQLILDIIGEKVIPRGCLPALLIMDTSLPWYLRKYGSYFLDRSRESILTDRCPYRVRGLGGTIK